jgi:hypothetical protein
VARIFILFRPSCKIGARQLGRWQRAQQLRMPVIRLLSGGPVKDEEFRVNAFREGLGETAYVEGRNVGFDEQLSSNRIVRPSGEATALSA